MKSIFLIVLSFVGFVAIAQDRVLMKSGEEIEVNILEVTSGEITYKKISMPDGPIYRVEKNEVFMVKYANGTKEVFGHNQTIEKAEATTLYKQNQSFKVDTTVGHFDDRVYPKVRGRIHGNNYYKIFNSSKITFYGYDFSYLKITNPNLVGYGQDIANQYFSVLNLRFNELLRASDMQRWMGLSNFNSNQMVFDNHKAMDYSKMVVDRGYNITDEDLSRIVKSYVLPENDGVGMVINLINFNKVNGYVIMYVTFFDIASREVLYSVETIGETSSIDGVNRYYPTAVNTGFRDVFLIIFKRKYASNGDIPNNLRLND